MELLSGKKIADEILTYLKGIIVQEKLAPRLAVILVGDDPASHLYVKLKKIAAEKIGIGFQTFLFPKNTTSTAIEECLLVLNQDINVHGILLQLPLPFGLDEDKLVQTIDPEKDADGFHRETLKKFLSGDMSAEPVFPRAIATLIRSAGRDLQGKKAVAIVNSELFGKIIDRTLRNLNLYSHIYLHDQFKAGTVNIQDATVVVSACGKAGMIRGEMLSSGAIVIDGGITLLNGKSVGDVDAESVASLAGFLSPVPGGVGPVTVASLLARVVDSARRKAV